MVIYRRRSYQIKPDQLDKFNQFFHDYLLPNQLRHGARLVGRYVTMDQTEILTIWEYGSIKDYEVIDEKIKQTDLHKQAQQRRKQLGDLYLRTDQDFLEATGDYHFPKQIVSVSGYITNGQGEVLLVRNEHRPDTYEMPGGRMESGETLEEAILREVKEETGVDIQIEGITGVYHNVTIGVVCIVFKGCYLTGDLAVQPGETRDVLFQELTNRNRSDWVTREHFEVRIKDAQQKESVAVESYSVRPYELLHRIEG